MPPCKAAVSRGGRPPLAPCRGTSRSCPCLSCFSLQYPWEDPSVPILSCPLEPHVSPTKSESLLLTQEEILSAIRKSPPQPSLQDPTKICSSPSRKPAQTAGSRVTQGHRPQHSSHSEGSGHALSSLVRVKCDMVHTASARKHPQEGQANSTKGNVFRINPETCG